MRTALAAREEERATFRGTFARFGTKYGWQGRHAQTFLLTEICTETGTPVCDHLWFNLTHAFTALTLQPGDVVQFDARIKQYVKGYFGRREDVDKWFEVDYKLSHPTRVKNVSAKPDGASLQEELPLRM